MHLCTVAKIQEAEKGLCRTFHSIDSLIFLILESADCGAWAISGTPVFFVHQVS